MCFDGLPTISATYCTWWVRSYLAFWPIDLRSYDGWRNRAFYFDYFCYAEYFTKQCVKDPSWEVHGHYHFSKFTQASAYEKLFAKIDSGFYFQNSLFFLQKKSKLWLIAWQWFCGNTVTSQCSQHGQSARNFKSI